MTFVLSAHFVKQLGALRKDYEKEARVDFKHSKQPYSLSLLFGAKDVPTRDKQILFIEQWLDVFKSHLSETNTFESKEALPKHITALRVLMVVGFYIKSQIDKSYTLGTGYSSTLERLMNKAMGVTATNMIDEETRACCFLAAKRYLSKENCYESVNGCLDVHFTEQQWHDFNDFITTECNLLDPKYKSDYPMTIVMMSMISKPMEVVGSATGYVVAGAIVNSGSFYPIRYALTGIIGSCVCVLVGPAGSTGAMLLAPTVVGHALDFFCGASLAWFMGNALRLVGQGVGLGVGLSLDLSRRLLQNASGVLEHMQPSPVLTGTDLVDGQVMIDDVYVLEDGYEDLSSQAYHDVKQSA